MRDDLAIVERAYDLCAGPREWQRALTEVVQRCLAGPMGAGSYRYDANNAPYLDVDSCVFIEMPPTYEERVRESFTALWAREVLPRGSACATATQQFAGARPGDPGAAVVSYWAPHDCLAIFAANPDGTGVCFGSVLPAPTTLARSFVRHWLRVATHVAAGHRLRCALLSGAAEKHEPEQVWEAVLDPSGRALDAVGPAQVAAARTALRQAVQTIDQARGRLRRDDPAKAVEVWRGLVAGRWSLVDRYESDGRRHYVAYRNSPDTPQVRALSSRERQVVAYAAQGHSNKLIGYTLGLSTSTVGAYLASARKKLGSANRTELVRLARLLQPSTLGGPRRWR